LVTLGYVACYFGVEIWYRFTLKLCLELRTCHWNRQEAWKLGCGLGPGLE